MIRRKFSVKNLRPTTIEELVRIINQRMEEEGYDCDLNDIDVSQITDMSYLFAYSQFNGDISSWDIDRVLNKDNMFTYCLISEENKPLSVQDHSKENKIMALAEFLGCTP